MYTGFTRSLSPTSWPNENPPIAKSKVFAVLAMYFLFLQHISFEPPIRSILLHHINGSECLRLRWLLTWCLRWLLTE